MHNYKLYILIKLYVYINIMQYLSNNNIKGEITRYEWQSLQYSTNLLGFLSIEE